MSIQSGALAIDRERYEVLVAGELVRLTYQEFNALWFIAAREGRVATYDELARELWGNVDERARRRLAVLMSRLRVKLGPTGAAHLDTVTRVGYRLTEPPTSRSSTTHRPGATSPLTRSKTVPRSRGLTRWSWSTPPRG